MTEAQMIQRIKELEKERQKLLEVIEANIKAHGTESLEVPGDAWVKILKFDPGREELEKE
jgi:hypothetical protein